MSNVIPAADLVAMLMLQGIAYLQKLAEIQSKARAEGREINIDDLAGLRAADMSAKADLDAAIANHGGH